MGDRIRVVVVDDHPLFRDGMTGLLATVPDVDVVGTAGDGEQAVATCAALRPDVVLMDLNLPGLSGLEAIRRVLREQPDVAVLVVTMVEDPQTVGSALRVGARGYVLKGAAQEEVLAALRTVAAGGVVVGSRAGADALAQRRRYDDRLSPRESAVFGLLAEGADNAQIARELGISLKTVQNHVSNILLKLGVANRTQAALKARGW